MQELYSRNFFQSFNDFKFWLSNGYMGVLLSLGKSERTPKPSRTTWSAISWLCQYRCMNLFNSVLYISRFLQSLTWYCIFVGWKQQRYDWWNWGRLYSSLICYQNVVHFITHGTNLLLQKKIKEKKGDALSIQVRCDEFFSWFMVFDSSVFLCR